MYFNDDYNNSEFSDHRIIELYCCSLNELFSREKTRSAAADEGCSSRIDLQATADEACMCYRPITGNCSAMGCHLWLNLPQVITPLDHRLITYAVQCTCGK